LEFKIAEVSATLKVLHESAQQEGTERMGVEFIGSHQKIFNGHQLYVLGRLRDMTPPQICQYRTHWLYET